MFKNILAIIILIFFSSILQAEEFKFKKIVNLNKPWGSSFINESELIITEKKGKIKIISGYLIQKIVEIGRQVLLLLKLISTEKIYLLKIFFKLIHLLTLVITLDQD